MSALPNAAIAATEFTSTRSRSTSRKGAKSGSVSKLTTKRTSSSWTEPPAWMASSSAYWREHDFGRGGRPAPGTKLILALASGFGIPAGATCAKVLPYDGRWVSSEFPVLLMRPNFEPTEVSWMLSVRPARNGDTWILNTYDLHGCKLAEGEDLAGTHVTGKFDVEKIVLRARRLQPVGSGGAE
ncbi:hypothetical protein [Lentzea sp. NBRC 102530]|uniref:hypothetical protein n=1 Tax=Lentzea sp. NBRC 102530 TaxID=3032201 RepID=UPI00249FDE5D|nr:hypothetical protein [Lentzea sp. NBRC 102530]GLY54807.1 hypothetical protein Lesp01_84620 [Lentzea sp. NBRC 102530]